MSLFKNANLNADQSALFLAGKLHNREPFIFIRYGDGALECINNLSGFTRDGEVYSKALGDELIRCWNLVINHPNACIGDWWSASFDKSSIANRYDHFYRELIGNAKPQWLHFETLLLMRETNALISFYRAVRLDTRKKLLMGPPHWAPAASYLKAEFIPIPISPYLFRDHLHIIRKILEKDFDVFLYGAGMAGNIPVIDYWSLHPEKTFINLGSALDPLARGKTRSSQLSSGQASRLFRLVCQ